MVRCCMLCDTVERLHWASPDGMHACIMLLRCPVDSCHSRASSSSGFAFSKIISSHFQACSSFLSASTAVML